MNARPVRLYRTAQFMADVGGYMSDHEQEAFYQHLARNPLLGEPMEEVPGCLVVEWGNGRVYIRYTVSDDRNAIVLISISEKKRLELDQAGRKQASDLMDTLKKAGIGAAIRELIDRLGGLVLMGAPLMSAGNEEVTAMPGKAEERFIAGLRDAVDWVEGRGGTGEERVIVPEEVDVQAIRRDLGLSQHEFALRYGFPVGTVRNWEQGRRRPEGAARLLLEIIRRRPQVVEEVLRQQAG